MAVQPSPAPVNHPLRPRRLRRLAPWLLGSLLLAPLLLYATRSWTLVPLAKGWAQRRALAAGYALEVGDIGGSLWSSLELENVALVPRDGIPGPLRSLRIKRARADYRLIELARSGLKGLENIDVQGMTLRLDADSKSPATGVPFRLPEFPLALPQVSIADIRLELRTDERTWRAEDAILAIGPGTQPQAITLDAPGLVQETGPAEAPERRSQVDLQVNATWDSALVEGEVSVDGAPWLVVDELDLRASALGEAHLSASLGLPADVTRLELAFVDHRARATLRAKDLRLAELDLEPFWKDAPAASGLAQLELQANQESDGWRLGGRALSQDLTLNGRPLGSLEALGAWEPAGLRVKRLEIEGQAGELRADGVFVPAAALRTGTALGDATGSVHIDTTDLPALLALQPDAQPPAHRLQLNGVLSAGRLALGDGGLDIGAGQGSASWSAGWIDLAAPPGSLRQIEVDAALDLPDLTAAGKLFGWSNLAGQLRGSLRLEGELLHPGGQIELDGEGVSYGGYAIDRLRLAGYGRSPSLVLSELVLRRGGDELALASPALLERGPDGIAFESLRLKGRGVLEVGLQPGPSGSGLQLRASNLALSPWLVGIAPAETRVEALNGSLGISPGAWRVDLSSPEVSVPGVLPPTPAKLLAEVADRRILLKRVALGPGDAPILELSGSAPLDPDGVQPEDLLPAGPIDLIAKLAWPAGAPFALPASLGSGQTLEGASGTVRLQGSWRDVHSSLVLRATRLTAAGGRLHGWFGDAPADVEANLVWRDGKVEILSSELNAKRGKLVAKGATWITSDWPALLAKPPAWSDLPLRLAGQLHAEELGWLASTSPTIVRASGELEASFDFEGTLVHPQGSASMQLSNAAARFAGLPPMDELEGRATLLGRTLTIERFSGQMGSGPFALSGTAGLEEGGEWELELEGEEVLLLRDTDARVRADMDLQLQGPVQEPQLTGTLGLRRVHLRENLDFLGLLRGRGGPPTRRKAVALVLAEQGALSKLLVDVRVETVEPIQFQSNVASGGLRGSLRLEGPGSGLVPTGDLFLDPSAIKLPGGKLRLTGGLVRFDPAHPLAPQLDVNGEARLAGYDITMRATGDLDAPQVDLSSSPALPVDQVLLLLLSGQLPEEGSPVGLSAARTLTVYLAKDLLSRWSGSDLNSNESWLDRLEIVSGQEVSRSGLGTLEASYRITDEERVDDRAWYVVAERDRYEDVNFGLRLVVRLR